MFEQALALDQQSAAAQSWLAIELTARVLDFMADTAAADIARAEDLAKRGLAVSNRSPVGHFAKGQVLRAQHRYKEAIPEYETVVALNRNWAHSYSHLGWCKFMTGSMEELIPAQEKAVRLSPRDPQIGLFYSRIGSRAFAAVAYRRGDHLVRKGTQCHSSTPGVPDVSRRSLCLNWRHQTRRGRACRSPPLGWRRSLFQHRPVPGHNVLGSAKGTQFCRRQLFRGIAQGWDP